MITVLLAAILAVHSVPDGKCVLVNGLLGPEEWNDSATVRLDGTTELRVHKDEDHLFLAVAFLGPRHTGIDLYLKSNDRTRMLHVSSALGEKERSGKDWSDYEWGSNTWWAANTIGSIIEDGKKRSLAPEAFEFQIDRRALGPEIRLYIHLKRPEKLLPKGASKGDEGNWLLLKFE